MNVDMDALKGAFEILGFGMGGIFLALFMLYLASLLLLKLLPPSSED